MFERPLLVYSNYCNHSNRFIDALGEHPELAETFLTLCIDIHPATKKRPDAFYQIQKDINFQISEVPTIIVEQGKYVLSGEEAFKWLNHTIEKMAKKELSAFNPNEMLSFSDQYSPYGSKEMNDASEQSFRFINRNYDNIDTPAEGTVTAVVDYQQKQKERDMSFKITPRPSSFSTPSSISKSMGGGGKGTHKQQDFDKRLQNLIAEREEIMPKRPPPQRVDFSRM